MAALPRVVYLFIHPPAAVNPYWTLSESLLRDGSLSLDGQQTTVFEPVYPLFVAAVRGVARAPLAVDLLQVAISAAGAALIAWLAFGLTGDRRVATTASLLYAIDPLLVRESVVRTESAMFLTLLLAFAALFVAARRPLAFALAGVCLGLSILTRTTALPLLVIAPGVLWARRQPANAAALFVAAALLAAPLPLRNHALNGSWWPTRSGINLFIGNCAYTRALLPEEDLDLLQEQAEVTMAAQRPDIAWLPSLQREREADVFLTGQALSYMRARPLETVAQKIRNVAYLLSPRSVPYRVATADARVVVDGAGRARVEGSRARPRAETAIAAVAQAFLLVFAAAGMYQRRTDWRADAILWAVIVTVVAVDVLYVPATRYRAPMEFAWITYAAVGVTAFFHRLSGGRRYQTRGPGGGV